MRPRGTRPEAGQRWAALSWQSANGVRRTVEVIRTYSNGKHVTVRKIAGTGRPEQSILAESLMAKYELLPPQEDSDAHQ